MEETNQHKPLLLESQGDVVVGKESQEEEDKRHRTFKPLFLESQEDIFVDEEESKKRRAPIRKVRFGLFAFFAIATAVVVFHLFYTSPECRSKLELMATVVLPAGVEVSNLNETAPQYLALEWLAYNDTRGLTIDDNATELLERFSLATFYYSVGEDFLRKSQYHDRSRWLNISSHCDWDNFNCDEDGRVTRLDPWGLNMMMHGKLNMIHGTLPTEIGNLKRLTYLNLGLNELVGPIPSEIGHLEQLTILELSSNQFSGPIPSEIGHLQQLKSLYLVGNQLSGPIPSEIGHLQQLEGLGLGYNKFLGPIPSEIGHLQQLESLGLGYNKFLGPIPSEIGHLQQLEDLVLSRNIGLTGTLPMEVGQLKSIREAKFSDTSLTGGLDDLAFCKNRHDHDFQLIADCGGLNPKITCECCTSCCRTGENGHTWCHYV